MNSAGNVSPFGIGIESSDVLWPKDVVAAFVLHCRSIRLRVVDFLIWLKSKLPEIVQPKAKQALFTVLQNGPIASGKNVDEFNCFSLIQKVNNQMTTRLIGQET